MSKKILEPANSFVMQLEPESHPQAMKFYQDGCANNWMPSEVNMTDDIKQWKTNEISEAEKLLVERALGLFAGTESLVASNLLFAVFSYLEDPCMRQYIIRQIFEESLHNMTVKICCECFQLSRKHVYEAHKNIPAVKDIDDFLMNATKGAKNIDISTKEGKQQFVKLLFTFYLICEGTLFYSTFAAILSLYRRNLLRGLGEQIKYTLRDEGIHVKFGVYVINTLRTEYKSIFTKKFETELIEIMEQAVELEKNYSNEILPSGILGITSEMFHQYTEFIANRRLQSIGLNDHFETTNNPFPWMSEVVDLSPQTNFFERTVEEYQQAGSLDWDDF